MLVCHKHHHATWCLHSVSNSKTVFWIQMNSFTVTHSKETHVPYSLVACFCSRRRIISIFFKYLCYLIKKKKNPDEMNFMGRPALVTNKLLIANSIWNVNLECQKMLFFLSFAGCTTFSTNEFRSYCTTEANFKCPREREPFLCHGQCFALG